MAGNRLEKRQVMAVHKSEVLTKSEFRRRQHSPRSQNERVTPQDAFIEVARQGPRIWITVHSPDAIGYAIRGAIMDRREAKQAAMGIAQQHKIKFIVVPDPA
jgi:hypothetical protein